jgi:hypothetical protein
VSADRIPFLPRGELHPHDRCVWCGSRGDERLRPVTTIAYAGALECEDVVACQRRYRKRIAA